eukprot:scaffold576_cov260-Pinguiococcus_pyrenoidosus.AAC.53
MAWQDSSSLAQRRIAKVPAERRSWLRRCRCPSLRGHPVPPFAEDHPCELSPLQPATPASRWRTARSPRSAAQAWHSRALLERRRTRSRPPRRSLLRLPGASVLPWS